MGAAPAADRVTVRLEEEAGAAQHWPADFFTRIAGAWSGPALARAPQGEFEIRKALD